jgi:microcompartment protein CcmK/EutM
MMIAKVVGNVVSTKKERSLLGEKLMLVSILKNDGYSRDSLNVAVDSVGAGIGEIVLVVAGSSARLAENGFEKPVDMNIIGIVDSMEIGGDELFDI